MRGSITERIVQNQLFVSFLIVKTVVEQGKWNKVKIKNEIAVPIVQP